MKPLGKLTINDFSEYIKKPLSTILREQKVNEKLAMMETRTNKPTKRRKTHEHKPDNNIRLQITIDCRIL